LKDGMGLYGILNLLDRDFKIFRKYDNTTLHHNRILKIVPFSQGAVVLLRMLLLLTALAALELAALTDGAITDSIVSAQCLLYGTIQSGSS
jgi:hypothetical protein